MNLTGISFSDTVLELENMGHERRRTAIHNSGQKAVLRMGEDDLSQRVALEETVVKIDGIIYRMYSAVDGEPTKFF